MAKPPPPADFDDNPEWTGEDFARAKPAADASLVRKRGRPAGSLSSAKQQVALRIDTDVVEAFKDSGPKWQTRMNDALRTRIDVTWSDAVKGWLVSVNRPIAGVAGRGHEIVGKFDSQQAAEDRAYLLAEREPGNPRVVVWPKAA